jgi:hypothetical protein
VSYDPEPEIKHYLGRLSRAARDLPRPRRCELLSEIELHIRMALARTPCANRDEMVQLLERVGDPAEIAAADNEQADASLPGGIASLRTRRPRRLVLALVALVVIGLAIGAAAWTQSYQPLAFAPADVLMADSVNTLGENGHGAWVGYRKGIGGGPHRPFFGVTIQNTGPFTVRVVGLGRYGPALPVLRGWSSRLLMAQGTFVQEPLGPSTNPIRDTNGRIVRRRAWKRGPLQPFHPVDLAPGQIVMIAFEGVWHMDCHPVTVGTTTPPRTFPVRYSFLWKTTTTQIPLPGGLTIDPANHHPYTDCHHGRGEPAPGNTRKHSA